MGDLYKLKFAFGNKWPKHVLTCKYHVVNEADARALYCGSARSVEMG